MKKANDRKRPTKKRISMWMDLLIVDSFKVVARRNDVPYQRLMQEALKQALNDYLPRWEEVQKKLNGPL
jgi:hypothetical protein